MADPGDGIGWGTNETKPTGNDAANTSDNWHIDLRKGVRIRTQKEHVTFAANSVGGEHLQGSAKAYYQSAAPTLRPDSATSLDADDAGRLFIDTDDDSLSVFNGTSFDSVAAGSIAGAGTTPSQYAALGALSTQVGVVTDASNNL